MKKNSKRDRFSALYSFYRVLSICNFKCLFKLSKIFSFVITHTKNQISTVTTKNIRLCFPELNAKQQKTIIKKSIQHTSCTFFELAAIWHQPIEKVLGNIRSENIDSNFFNENRPKVIISPHHGSWELLNLWLANTGTLYSLYKPARSLNINQYVLKSRTRNGAILVPANVSGLRTLLKGLKNSAKCLILPDQRPANETAQINAPFFNYPAATSLLIKKLASKIDCDFFIASVTRDLTTAEYLLTLQSLDRSKILTDDFSSACYLNKRIELLIQKNKAQYQWSYKRFSVDVYHQINS